MKMYKISREDAIELRKEMKKTKKNVNAYKRLEAVAYRGEGKTNKEIAELTGYNSDYVGMLAKKYVAGGIKSLLEDGRKGGNNRKLDEEASIKFLEKFAHDASAGQITTVEKIAEEYDKVTGKERKSRSSVYYFLHRNGWRVIKPTQKHPHKASDEDIDASKKLTLN
jgi:transposase